MVISSGKIIFSFPWQRQTIHDRAQYLASINLSLRYLLKATNFLHIIFCVPSIIIYKICAVVVLLIFRHKIMVESAEASPIFCAPLRLSLLAMQPWSSSSLALSCSHERQVSRFRLFTLLTDHPRLILALALHRKEKEGELKPLPNYNFRLPSSYLTNYKILLDGV